MKHLFNWGQRGKPEVSAADYSEVFNQAIEYVAEIPWPQGNLHNCLWGGRFDQQAISDDTRAFSIDTAKWIEQGHHFRIRLEAIRPDGRLQELHRKTVIFVRGRLSLTDRWGLVLRLLIQGDVKGAIEKRREHVRDYEALSTRMEQDLNKELSALLETNAALFGELRIPEKTLSRIGLNPRQQAIRNLFSG